MASQKTAEGRGFPVWTALAGAVAGAIVVGAIWGATSVAGATGGAGATEATVNGKAITHATLSKTLFTQYGRQTLQQMIDDRLVQTAAKADGLTATASAISQAQAQFESAYGITSPAALASFLQQNGLSNAQLQTILKNQVLEQELSVRGIKVSAKEIAAYYKSHASTFTITSKGKKTLEPLSQVKSAIVSTIQQSKAPTPTALLAKLAKQYKLTVVDPAYKSLQSAIETATSSVAGG